MNIILLHGYGFDHQIWYAILPSLKNNFNVYAPDLPGFGISPDLLGYSMEDLADWLNNWLDERELTDFILVGHSMGGYLSLSYLDRYPINGCKGLFLLHSHGFPDSEVKKIEREKKATFISNHGKKPF